MGCRLAKWLAEKGYVEADDAEEVDEDDAIEGPEEISRRCQAGWTISGIVGRAGKTWRLIEAWNVYPRGP